MEHFYIIIVLSLIAVNCSTLGTFLLLREATMLADAISHSILPGIVISFLITKSMSLTGFIIGAIIVSLLTGLSISFLNNYFKIQIDVAIGIIFTTLFALGIILISFFTSKVDLDQDCIIQGDPIYIPLDLVIIKGYVFGPKAMYLAIFSLFITFIYVYTSYKKLLINTFDTSFSESIGIKTNMIHYSLFIITSITAVISFESIGSIMVIALIVLPPATAYLSCKNLKTILLVTSLIGIITTILGYYISLLFNVAVSASIVVVQGILFCIIFGLNYIKTHTNIN